jgi:molybdopterin molybdotransferase
MTAVGREFFTVKTVAQALEEFRPTHRTGAEAVTLQHAHGRVPATPVTAREPLPGFDRSSVDGYAVRAADTYGASESIPAYVRVIGAVRMGQAPELALSAESAIAVPTGAMVPAGADAIVMIEHTHEAMPGTIEVVRPVAPGEGIVRGDEDLATGATIVAPGRPLRAADVALLAAAGVAELQVHRPPVVAIIATGDEVVAPQTVGLAPGQVRDALSVSVGALVSEAGGLPRPPTIASDEPGELERVLAQTTAQADVIVICAGSSVGIRDLTAGAVAALPAAEIYCHGLAIKPGKPTLLARFDGRPIIGLPGNPRSALAVFRLIGMPLVRRAGGWTAEPVVGTVRARMARDVPSAAGRLDIVQVRLIEGEAEPLFGPSALLTVLTAADGYVILDEDATGLAAGEQVEVIPYG